MYQQVALPGAMASDSSTFTTCLPTEACYDCTTADARWIFTCSCKGSLLLCDLCANCFCCPCCSVRAGDPDRLRANSDFSTRTLSASISASERNEQVRQSPACVSTYASHIPYLHCPACGHNFSDAIEHNVLQVLQQHMPNAVERRVVAMEYGIQDRSLINRILYRMQRRNLVYRVNGMSDRRPLWALGARSEAVMQSPGSVRQANGRVIATSFPSFGSWGEAFMQSSSSLRPTIAGTSLPWQW